MVNTRASRIVRYVGFAALAALVLVGAWGVAVSDARADEPSVAAKKRTSTLGWDRLPGADSCVATQPLARAVETRLGRKVFVSPAEADVSVEGRVVKKGTGFSATLVLRDAEGKVLGTRSLEKGDPSCTALTEALVLVIAVMIDPDAALAPPPVASSPPPAPSAPPAPPEPRIEKVYVPVPVPVPVPAKEKPSRPALMIDGALSGRLAIGVVPDPGVGVSLVGVLVPRGFIGILGRATFVLPRSTPVLAAEVSFSHGTLASGLCPLAHTFGPVFLSACAEGELGLLLARPSGLPRAVNEARVTLAGGGSFGASLLVAGPVTVRLGASAMLPFVRESFEATLADGTKTEVFRQLPVTLAGELGLGLRFP